MKRLYDIFWYWLPPIGYMVAIFVVSSQSQPNIGGETPDYVLHMLEYFLLGLLLIRLFLAIYSQHRPGKIFHFWWQACLFGFLLTIAYGISDEIHQYFVPGRHCSLHDVFSDSIGALLAFGGALIDHILFKKSGQGCLRSQQFPPYRSILYSGYQRWRR